MHELSLCEQVLQLIEDNAKTEGYRRVKRVWLEIGELSCVESESLRFCFDIVCQNTLAEGADLEIITVDSLAQCPVCSQNHKIATRYEPCPTCQYRPLTVIQGDSMRVKQLEVE